LQGNCTGALPAGVSVPLLTPRQCYVASPGTFMTNAPPYGNKLWLDGMWLALDRTGSSSSKLGSLGVINALEDAAGNVLTANVAWRGPAGVENSETKLWVTNSAFQGDGLPGSLGIDNFLGKLCLNSAPPALPVRSFRCLR
jgi:hypothetical protein